MGTDAIFACNARTALQSMSAFVPAYQYEFNDENAPPFFPNLSFPTGAYHAAELQYLFAGLNTVPLSQDQQRLSAAMTGYWTQFATRGTPNAHPQSAPVWPGYTTVSEQFQSLVPPTPASGSGFAAEHKCTFWGG